jgi:hypothetical protein
MDPLLRIEVREQVIVQAMTFRDGQAFYQSIYSLWKGRGRGVPHRSLALHLPGNVRRLR